MDESQYCWFIDRFLQYTFSVIAKNKSLTFIVDLAHCVLSTASVRTLLEGGILRGMIRFEKLYLSDTQVSDVSPLAKLTNLEVLYFTNTRVRQEAMEQLKRALPLCVLKGGRRTY